MENDRLTHQVITSLVLEALAGLPTGQVFNVSEAVAKLAVDKCLVPGPSRHMHGGDAEQLLGSVEASRVAVAVQEILWRLMVQSIIAWGSDSANKQYPFFRVTEHGRAVLADNRSQPYDPDGFLQEFDRLVPNADAVVRAYLEEAVRAFNARCFRAAAILLGGASEKAILLLHDQFVAAISDDKKKEKLAKDSSGSIHRKYRALHERLLLMAQAKALPFDHVETVNSELPAGFDLIRRYRNSAGHPTSSGEPDQDTTFLNIRMFTEYARRVFGLIEHFRTNPAQW